MMLPSSLHSQPVSIQGKTTRPITQGFARLSCIAFFSVLYFDEPLPGKHVNLSQRKARVLKYPQFAVL